MEYGLFIYNMFTCFVCLTLCLVFAAFARAQRARIDTYISVLFGLYTVDILFLFMYDFIPQFQIAYHALHAIEPYFYSVNNFGILFCYRLILGQIIEAPLTSREGQLWIFCFAGDIVSLFAPDAYLSTVLNELFPLPLYAIILTRGAKHISSRNHYLRARSGLALVFLLISFAICELSDTALALFYSASPAPTAQRAPFEILGWIYTLAALWYLRERWRKNVRAAEEHLIHTIARRYNLTERETDVFEHLAQGLDNRAIAEAEVVSVGTVKTHVHNVVKKLPVENRAEIQAFVAAERDRARRITL